MKKQLNDLLIVCYAHSIKLCLYIRRNCKNKILQNLIFALLAPYIVLKCIIETVYEYTLGKVILMCKLKKEESKAFQYELAIVAIAKNESAYIREWLEYHLIVGVQKFYIYDNESTDDLKQVLQPYIDTGIVEYTYYPGKAKQLNAYNDAIKRYMDECRYMAFVDCDEYVTATNADTCHLSLLKVVIDAFKKCKNAGGIAINWCLYGSSGYEKYQEGLLTERFLKRANDDDWHNLIIKTIVNPRLVKDYVSPHFPIYRLGAWSINTKGKRVYVWYNTPVDFSKLRCNHYFCKSKEEFIKKAARGLADRKYEHYDMTKFHKYDVNDLYDNLMLRYSSMIKQRMKQ